MNYKNGIYTIDTHTEGEPTRVIAGGLPKIPGGSIKEKKEYFRLHYDHFRQGALMEPRGHRDMVGAVVTPPCSPEADLGVFFIDSEGYIDMCGHGSIGVCVAAVETGMAVMTEPVTRVTLECPAGLIRAKVEVSDGKARSVTIVNVDSFVYKSGIEAVVPGLGSIEFDVAYGGNFAALIKSEYFGLNICPQNLPGLIEKATVLNDWINGNLEVRHPLHPEICGVNMIEVWGPAKSRDADYQNVVIFGGSIDRSPCGVGTSAKMALMVERGELDVGQEFISESVIYTKFKGVALKKTRVGEYDAIVPQITASAYITGFNYLVFDPGDPVLYGFRV